MWADGGEGAGDCPHSSCVAHAFCHMQGEQLCSLSNPPHGRSYLCLIHGRFTTRPMWGHAKSLHQNSTARNNCLKLRSKPQTGSINKTAERLSGRTSCQSRVFVRSNPYYTTTKVLRAFIFMGATGSTIFMRPVGHLLQCLSRNSEQQVITSVGTEQIEKILSLV